MSPQRWAKLCEVLNDIDVAIERLVMKDANVYYCRYLGGTWFVTIRSRVWWYVDIRKYLNSPSSTTRFDDVDDDLLVDDVSINGGGGGEISDIRNSKPSSVGLRLQIREWRVLKKIAPIVDFVRADAQSCFYHAQAGKLSSFLSELVLPSSLLITLSMLLSTLHSSFRNFTT